MEEWDTDALSRKYHGTICKIKVGAETFLGKVLVVGTPDERSPVINVAKLTKGGIYEENLLRFAVRTTRHHEKHKEYKTAELFPLTLKPKIFQTGKSVGQVSRRLTKSFHAGIERLEYLPILRGKETLNTEDLLCFSAKDFKNSDEISLLSDNILIEQGTVFVLGVRVGFGEGKEIKIGNPAVRKLVSEKVPGWKINLW